MGKCNSSEDLQKVSYYQLTKSHIDLMRCLFREEGSELPFYVPFSAYNIMQANNAKISFNFEGLPRHILLDLY